MAAHDSAILTRSGGPPAAALSTSAASRKYCGPMRGWRDGAEGLHVLAAVVVEPMNGAARNAEGLPGPTSIGLPSTVQVSTPSMP